MSGIHRGAWAVEVRGKMNDQTKADVDTFNAALRVGKDQGRIVFEALCKECKWKLGEASAIEDVAKTLAKNEL